MKKTIRQQRHLASATGRLAGMALGLLALLGAPGMARAQYAFTRIDVPGAVATYADGNVTHRVVGEFDDADGNTHGFVMRNGEFTQFDVPGADGYTSINGINGSGDRAGIYFADDRFYGYFWSRGVVTTLDPPDSNFSVASFVNAKGEVVGYSRKDLEPRHGFVWRDGVFSPVDVPGASSRGTRPIGNNNRGQVVGGYGDPDGHLHGFLLSGGEYTTFAAPGSTDGDGFTWPQGINDYGQIVGFYAKADGVDHGFVMSKSGFTTIDVPDSLWTDIYSVDAKGNIVGAFEDASGVHGFRGTPAGRLEPDSADE